MDYEGAKTIKSGKFMRLEMAVFVHIFLFKIQAAEEPQGPRIAKLGETGKSWSQWFLLAFPLIMNEIRVGYWTLNLVFQSYES